VGVVDVGKRRPLGYARKSERKTGLTRKKKSGGNDDDKK
jgi:hypothetical protein